MATGIFAATDERIRTIGRTFQMSDEVWLSYTTSGVEVGVTGTCPGCLLLSDEMAGDPIHAARYAVYVDGRRIADGTLQTRETSVSFWNSTEPESHVVRILKLSECSDSVMGLRSITTDGTLFRTEERSLKIEFVGDSITCGYGVDGVLGDLYSTANEDGTAAYAYLTGEALRADCSMVSVSGFGIISGYTGDGVIHPEEIVPKYYETMGFSYGHFGGTVDPATVAWDFSRFVPDLVVINLGTNDASYTDLDPTRTEVFRDRYAEFLRTVRKQNPAATIICTLGIMDTRLCQSVEEAVRIRRDEGDDRLTSMRFALQDGERDGLAVDWHPSRRTQEKSARQLTDYLHTLGY